MVASPGWAVSASVGSFGFCGDAPEPDPADPPLLMNTMVPEIYTPDGLILMKLPPTFRVSVVPDSSTRFIPDLRWISWPASTACFCPTFCSRSMATLRETAPAYFLVLVAADLKVRVAVDFLHMIFVDFRCVDPTIVS